MAPVLGRGERAAALVRARRGERSAEPEQPVTCSEDAAVAGGCPGLDHDERFGRSPGAVDGCLERCLAQLCEHVAQGDEVEAPARDRRGQAAVDPGRVPDRGVAGRGCEGTAELRHARLRLDGGKGGQRRPDVGGRPQRRAWPRPEVELTLGSERRAAPGELPERDPHRRVGGRQACGGVCGDLVHCSCDGAAGSRFVAVAGRQFGARLCRRRVELGERAPECRR